MNSLTFEFTESMMTICLLANGWTRGWVDGQWVGPGMDPDPEVIARYTLKEAFSRLLDKNHLYSHQFETGWKAARTT